MRIILAFVLVVHGLIHALGFAQGFGLAKVAQLPPIGPRAGLLWLTAALLLLAAATIVLLDARAWWMPALAGVILSQALIVTAWSEAKYGTLANVIVLVPLALLLLDFRGASLRN